MNPDHQVAILLSKDRRLIADFILNNVSPENLTSEASKAFKEFGIDNTHATIKIFHDRVQSQADKIKEAIRAMMKSIIAAYPNAEAAREFFFTENSWNFLEHILSAEHCRIVGKNDITETELEAYYFYALEFINEVI